MRKPEIIEKIRLYGAIPLDSFIAAALYDKAQGYYMQPENAPLGRDFTTAPEISQLYGEILAIWLIKSWRGAGKPKQPLLLELGPGRGILCRDIWRALAIEPELRDNLRLAMVEISPSLRQIQLAQNPELPILHYNNLDAAPAGFSFIIANEFFDALPIKQFIQAPINISNIGGAKNGFFERFVAWQEDNLIFTKGRQVPIMPHIDGVTANSISEYSPQTSYWGQAIANRLQDFGGAALLIDYGYNRKIGELLPIAGSLQAIWQGQKSDPLQHIGQSDLSAWVDFARLGEIFTKENLKNWQIHKQQDFLYQYGIAERAKLLQEQNPTAKEEISIALERLTSPDYMGSLFKLLEVINF